jgi:hypothetical protein
MANGKKRIIGAHGAGPNEDGITLCAQLVHSVAGNVASDSATHPRLCSDVSINRHCQLEHHVRSTGAAVVKVRSKLVVHGFCCNTDVDANARFAESTNASPGNSDIGVFHANHHA